MSRGTKALEMWCRRQIEGYPGITIQNMTTSWKNGMAFCALVHHFRPDLIDFDKLNKADVYYNNELAFRLAEVHLGIPALLDAADMAMYEVPDRLSILTYLSQYYQRFASQESKIIPSPDKSTTITNATTPPQKMAHVGVPKREPCQKCGNPVFFAERLTISKSLYHRTCLRCARCDSQLTPGSFYETEVDGVFCCETCPDEEKKNNSNERLGGSNSLDDSDIDMFKPDQHRQSFSEKLAMFQTNGKGLLQKSLSDEEKSKSLKRLSELYAKHQTHTDEESKIIVSPSVVKPVLQPIANADNTSSNASSSESEDDDDDEDEKPPLPTNQPPSLSSDMNLATSIVTPTPAKPKPPPKANVLNKIYGNTEKFNSIIAKPIRSDLSSATQSETNAFTTHHNPSLAVNTESSQIDPHFEKPIANSINKDEIDFTTPTTINGINVFATLEPVISCSVVKRNSIEDEKTNLNVDNNMPSDALNSFTNVTKEVASAERMKNNNDVENDHHNMDNGYAKSNDASKFITSNDDERNKLNDTVEMRSHPYEQKEANEQSISRNCIENNSNDTIIDKQAPTNDDIRNKSTSSCSNSSNNMVRSRLSQFEALLFTEPKQTHSNNDSPKLSNRNTLAVVEFSSRPTDQSIKINTTDIVTRINTTTTIESDPIDNAIESNSLTLNTNVPAEEKEEEKEEFTSKINNRTTLVKLIENKEIDQTTPMHNEINGQISGSDQFMASLRKKPIPVKRVTKDVQEIADTFQLPPTPSKRKNRSNTFDVICRDEEQKKSIEITTNTYETEKLVTKNVIVAEITEPLDQIKEKTPKKNPQYPLDLNPFGSDDEDMDDQTSQDSIMLRNGNETAIKDTATNSKNNLNPFDSSDDEVELLKEETPKKTPIPQKPSTFRVSTNPFGSDSEDEAGENDSMPSKRMPIPTPRKPLNGSGHSTPEPSPRMSRTLHPRMRLSAKPIDDFYGSNASLASSNYRSYDGLTKNAIVHGSMSSLASTLRHKKGRAPAIPSSSTAISSVESSPFKMNSTNSSPSHSVRATPLSRKKRAAPPPPKSMLNNETTTSILYVTANSQMDDSFVSKASADESLTSSTLENSSVHLDTSIESSNASTMPSSTDFGIESTHYITTEVNDISSVDQNTAINGSTKIIEPVQRKLIPIDASLLSDFPAKNITEMPSEENVTYRRTIVPTDISDTPIKGENVQTNDRQWEKMKENKESQNKNRQSQILISPTIIAVDLDALYGPNKSSYGKWKRRKGPAPSLPVPPRKIIQMLPLQEIRHELEVIEVQQQGLEKQGVMLEKMIRERCEGKEHENTPIDEYKPNTKEVEDLILQLFELVNEKNELFRRQAELMYLRRQHRLEQEQADIEYEIRVLMAQPECNKTDSDKSREEALISRLVEVVQLRNEVIESLEMDRLREAEEDQSIKERLELHTAKRDEELSQQTPTKLSKKEKKKQKESKKLAKQKKVDADKDADESELSAEKTKEKKKKKKFLF